MDNIKVLDEIVCGLENDMNPTNCMSNKHEHNSYFRDKMIQIVIYLPGISIRIINN